MGAEERTRGDRRASPRCGVGNPPVFKPVPGMTPHGALSNVPIPIPPNPLESRTTVVAPGLSGSLPPRTSASSPAASQSTSNQFDPGSTSPLPQMPPRLHQGQQDKHIPGTNNYELGKSILDYPDPQRLLNQHAGTTTSVNKVPLGQPGSKERVDFGQIIGRFRDEMSGSYVPTVRGMIHYGKQGAHIVPIEP